MRCLVSLHGADGRQSAVLGELEVSGGKFRLSFALDGDDFSMEGNDRHIVQSRRGSLISDMTFSTGKSTVCVFGEGELTCEIPVYTNSIAVDLSDGLDITIKYDLGGIETIFRAAARYISLKEKK